MSSNKQPALRHSKRKRNNKENHYTDSDNEVQDPTIIDDSQRNPTARMRESARLQTIKENKKPSATTAVGAPPTASSVKDTKTKFNGNNSKSAHVKVPASEMTEEERKEDRARRNRASALKSRNKRRQRLAFLEVECKKLFERIRLLENENAGLKCENSTLREQRDVAASSPVAHIRHSTPLATHPVTRTTSGIIPAMPPPASPRTVPIGATAKHTKPATPTLLPLESLFDFSETLDQATQEVGRVLASSSAWTAADDAVLDIDWDVDDVRDSLSVPPSPKFGCGDWKFSSIRGGIHSRQSSFDRLIS